MTSVEMSSLSSPGMFNFIRKRDHALMHRIHHWPAPDWVRLLMVVASRGGDGWIWYGLGFLMLLFGDHYRFVAVFAGSASTAVGLGIYSVVKKATRRLRPCLIEPNEWAHMLPPVGTYHCRVLDCNCGGFVLPNPVAASARLCICDCDLAHSSRYALSKRCRGGSAAGHLAWLRRIRVFSLTDCGEENKTCVFLFLEARVTSEAIRCAP